MKRIAAIALVLSAWITPAAFADDVGQVPMTIEEECRKELGIETTATLTPGLTRGKLRDCIRDRAAETRRPETRQDRPTLQNRIQRAMQEALKLQQQAGSNAVVSPESTRSFDLACRETLNITKDEVLLPGLRKQMLLNCIDRLRSEESRAANTRSRRGSLLDRTDSVGDKVLEDETNLLKGKLDASGAAVRFRIHKQRPIDADRLENIRDSLRARTDFSNEYRKNSKAEKRLRAEKCRKFTGSERGACLRDALSDDAQEE